MVRKMQWQKNDMEQYITAKEYVDTLLIPMMPLHLADDQNLDKRVFQGELLKIYVNEIEKQFRGRIFLTPSYNYLFTADKVSEISRLNGWIKELSSQPFKHVFLFTFDHHWKKSEQELQAELLWLPAMQSGNLEEEGMKTFIKEQITQVTELIQSYW